VVPHDLRDAVETQPTVGADALVDVVGDQAQLHGRGAPRVMYRIFRGTERRTFGQRRNAHATNRRAAGTSGASSIAQATKNGTCGTSGRRRPITPRTKNPNASGQRYRRPIRRGGGCATDVMRQRAPPRSNAAASERSICTSARTV